MKTNFWVTLVYDKGIIKYYQRGREIDIVLDILLFFKCIGGVISGPSVYNYEEPEQEWT